MFFHIILLGVTANCLRIENTENGTNPSETMQCANMLWSRGLPCVCGRCRFSGSRLRRVLVGIEFAPQLHLFSAVLSPPLAQFRSALMANYRAQLASGHSEWS